VKIMKLKKHYNNPFLITISTVLILAGVISCSGTQQTDHSFYIKPTSQTFGATQAVQSDEEISQPVTQEVNRSVDLLWVVDNSASMEVSQEKLRKAFSAFSKKYMTPSLDIRTAVITTDLYLANPAFSDYWNSTLTDHTTKQVFTEGQTVAPDPSASPTAIHPKWNTDYAKLLPGIHDGPIPAMCDKGIMGDFWLGPSKCEIRDNPANGTGAANCLNPLPGQTQITQCVNTVNNNTIHSGQPILSTIPPQGENPADWQTQITNNFLINMSVGTSGSGEEKGLGSLLQFLTDNEAPTSTTAFFRPGSLRVIVFLSDEDDQSQIIPTSSPLLKADSDYNYTSCPSKTVDGFTYSLTYCVEPSSLMSISDIKNQVDAFFNKLDGITSGPNPNYLVASVVSSTGATVERLQNLQKTMQKESGLRVTTDQDLGERYIEFANQVGNGSEVIDIGAEDYTSVLQNIGQKIVKSIPVQVPVTTYAPIGTFELNHAANPNTPPILTIMHADGSSQVLTASQYTVSGTTVTITDQSVLQSLASGDRIQVMYKPNGAYQES
jgi:hypothetical protein